MPTTENELRGLRNFVEQMEDWHRRMDMWIEKQRELERREGITEFVGGLRVILEQCGTLHDESMLS